VSTPIPDFALTEVVPGSHIYVARNALDRGLCQDVIDRFEASPEEQYAGRVGQDAHEQFEVKKSTDLVVSGKPHWSDVDQVFLKSLGQVMGVMRERHAFFRGPFKDLGYAIQRTLPGEHYHWHVDGGSHSFSDRQLVAIWYLNDVPGPGGETEFRHYDSCRIRPEAGKLLVFPPFWTHEHRGVTLESGVKYIATTWVLFA